MDNYEYYIFDVDGTLVDTSELIALSIKQTVYKVNNIHVNVSDVMQHIKKSPLSILKLYNINDMSLFWKFYDLNIHLARFYFKETKEILVTIKERGKTLGIVSSLPRQKIINLLNKLTLLSLFPIIVGWERAVRRKPNPDPILRALAKANLTPNSALYVGDTEADIISAQKAGVLSIFASWGGHIVFENVFPEKTITHISELLLV